MAEVHPIKNCLVCNKPFEVKTMNRGHAKYCSVACRKAVRQQVAGSGPKTETPCLNCGKKISYYPSQGVRKYCNRECKHAHWKTPSADRGFMDLTKEPPFDRLTVIEYAGKSKSGHHMWRCRCSCPAQTITTVSIGSLRTGAVRSCGCIGRGVGIPKPETKTCTKCNQEFPFTEEFFIKRGSFRWGLTPWCRTCYLPIFRKRHKKFRARLKLEVLTHYSGGEQPFCACCGLTGSLHFLTLDHINDDGGEDRKIHGLGAVFYAKMKKLGYPPTLQVLCWSCNLGRRDNGGVCPHKVYNVTYRKVNCD